MSFKVNWRFLLKLAAAVTVFLAVVHFVHRRQVRQQVGAFLHQADVARAAGEPEREITYLRRYLVARPEENDIRERLGRLICKSAKSDRDMLEGYLVLEDVLGRDPGRDELRRFAIDYAMKLGQFPEALADIEVLLAKVGDAGELEGLKARCLVQSKKYSEAEGWFKRAIAHRPDLLDSYTGLASVLRALKRVEEADAAVAAMLSANRGRFRAHLLVGEYWRTFWGLGEIAFERNRPVAEAQQLKPNDKVITGIENAVTRAQELAPDELDVILAVSDVFRFRSYELARSGDRAERERAGAAFAEAHRVLKEGLAKHPKEPAVYLALAAREAEQKREREAVAVIKEGLEKVPDSSALALALLDYQIDAGDAPAAAETLEKLKGRGLPSAQTEVQQGRILMLREEWLEAALVLDHARRNAPDDLALTRRTSFFLGRCYEQLGVPDRRLEAFRRAVPADMTDALWIPAMLGVAEAETALGRADEALRAYAQLKDRGVGLAFVQVARLRMIAALPSLAGNKPDWAATEEALAEAEKVLPKDTEIRILRATLLSLQGQSAEARKRLEALKSEEPKDVTVRIALAAQDQSEGNPKLALFTLEAAEKELGDSSALRLARARLWAESKEPELERKLEGLAEVDGLPPAQQTVLLRGLAELATATTAGPLGARLWDRVAGRKPHDLGVQLIRLDMALRSDDPDKYKTEKRIVGILNEVYRIDGDGGSSARLARAVFLIWRARNTNETAGLDEASLLLDGLDRERGGWARVAFAQARVHDLRGNRTAALVHYRKAVDYGESSPEALRRLLELLRADEKFEEAAVVLRRLPKASIADGAGQRIAAEVALRTKNPAQAVVYADGAVAPASKDPAEYVWQGQIYDGAGENGKAEAAYRKAADLRPEVADGWLILADFLTRTGRRTEAEQLLDAGKVKVNEVERSLFLARGYALVRRTERATEAFKRARAERPDDVRVLRSEAEFLFESGQLPEAREAFRRVLASQPASAADKDFARQMVGICLAADADYATSRHALEAVGLVASDRLRPPAGNETPAERRARVVVLALQRDRTSRLEAVRLLEADRNLSPNEQFLLAQLYRVLGDRPRVRVVMSGLLRTHDRVALYVRFYAAWLLRVGDPAEAEEWVTHLTKLQPDALSTAELRARLAAARGDPAAARKIIVPRAEVEGAPVLAIAQVCESIKLYDDAEQLFKRAAERTGEKAPQAALALAAFYGRRGRTADALRICDEVRRTGPALPADGVAVQALYAVPAPGPADVVRVAEWLDGDAKKADGTAKAALVQLLASVRNLQGDYPAAMGLYRNAIAGDPRDVVAMNNLALLISCREGKHDEALLLLERAKKVSGPSPDLLDTEAVVRLNKNDKNEAVAARLLLEAVVAGTPSGSAYYHLARAELAAGREAEARGAWQQAQELGVKLTDLHPLERQEFGRVSDLLK